MTNAQAEPMSYAGFCLDCGGMVAAVVDDPNPKYKARVRKSVADFMRDGCSIQRVTCQFVRDNLRGCTPTCPCASCIERRRQADAKTQTDLLAALPVSERREGTNG